MACELCTAVCQSRGISSTLTVWDESARRGGAVRQQASARSAVCFTARQNALSRSHRNGQRDLTSDGGRAVAGAVNAGERHSKVMRHVCLAARERAATQDG